MTSASGGVRSAAASVLGGTQSALPAATGAGLAGSGGTVQLVVAPGSDGAVATMLMSLVRSGKLQLKVA
jgi:hypothetical protein